jgi:CDP-paratose 2-epimerase
MARSSVALVTGGAGFVGTNLADRLLNKGGQVRVLDNLSRAGAAENLAWLRGRHDGRLSVVVGDVRDRGMLRTVLPKVTTVFHLAGQVAVTSSLSDPELDFSVNAGGTLALLEEIRRMRRPPALLFTSTNKVYGPLGWLALRRESKRLTPVDPGLRENGLAETLPTDPSTPYGCSKAAADRYVLDYAHSFGLRTGVFRMSCIVGPRQHGTEDQGWVSHFVRRSLARSPLTVFGDGAQVRDLLHVSDLVDAMLRWEASADRIAGRAFNIGGGSPRALSVLELVDALSSLQRRQPDLAFSPERTGDQRWYVSDTTAFREETAWRPTISPLAALGELCREHRSSRRRAARSHGLGAAERRLANAPAIAASRDER